MRASHTLWLSSGITPFYREGKTPILETLASAPCAVSCMSPLIHPRNSKNSVPTSRGRESHTALKI